MPLTHQEALIEFLAKNAAAQGRRVDISELNSVIAADLHRAQAVIQEIENFKCAVSRRLQDAEVQYLKIVARAMGECGRKDVAEKIAEAVTRPDGPEGVAVAIDWADQVMDYHFLDEAMRDAVLKFVDNDNGETKQ